MYTREGSESTCKSHGAGQDGGGRDHHLSVLILSEAAEDRAGRLGDRPGPGQLRSATRSATTELGEHTGVPAGRPAVNKTHAAQCREQKQAPSSLAGSGETTSK